jgi:5'-3' exonuclease
MGIKGLNTLLKRVCESRHVSLVPICNFAYKKIAIDAALYVCAFKLRLNYVESIIEFLTTLRENRIHPFFVFDGTAPSEKRNERIERARKRDAAKDRIKMLEHDLEVYKITGDLSPSLREIDVRVRSLVPTKISEKKIKDYIEKLKSQILTITAEDFDTMKSILTAFDIPYITADGEGEFLCAALCRHGLVDAVMSCDTDVLACLAPIVIKHVDANFFHVISLAEILTNLNLTEKSFIDMCIMCGTDFNLNIAKIGPIKSYDYIRKYETIDALPSELDIARLNHVRVREIFAYSNNIPTVVVPFSGRVNYEKLSVWLADTRISEDSIKLRIKPPTIVTRE